MRLVDSHFSFSQFALTRLVWILCLLPVVSHGMEGYYRWPALHGDTVVFSAEGDLWTVPVSGGSARRLTTHPGEERYPKISPDGKTIAFTATYEGPAELYTMPMEGGLPQRWTYEAEESVATAWTPSGELVYTTTHYSTLPDRQLVALDLGSKGVRRIPLSQASEASFDDSGNTVFFVRPPYHRNVTKRYSGGTARQIWSFTEGESEAMKLTTDHLGESHHPMWWSGRVYFVTDRDGVMNLWSMRENGSDLRQHTEHLDFDVRQPYLNEGRIVYHRAGDLWLYDIRTGENRIIPINLVSDLDQLREKWVMDPSDYITHVAFHPEGKQLAITARGRVFVIPVESGRLVTISREPGVRYRDAVFSGDGKSVIALSDASSEFEFVRHPATGIGESATLTQDGSVLRFAADPSPDGKWLVYPDLENHLWLLETETGAKKMISTNNNGIGSISWSPDSKWIAFEQMADNTFDQILLFGIEEGSVTELTTDRANSYDPVWDPKGEWIYFLSDRNFETLVGSPWGTRQPEPYFDRKMKIYQVSLKKGLRSPFRPDDELVADEE
ncbi:MAG: PD40 domain-containing protein, partial [Verrucomicrobiae bacterium]|nr:PD40 domain-containing protein [Verrucomicrobiae bacterium]